jgi:hypothetical protein
VSGSERVIADIDAALSGYVEWQGSDDAAEWNADPRETLRRRLLLQLGDSLRRYATEDGTAVARCYQCDLGQAIRDPLTHVVDGVTCCSACGRRMLRRVRR